jgi:tryptophan 2,3-dioxygenase
MKDEAYLRFFKSRPEIIKVLQDRLKAPDLRGAYYSMLRKLGYKIPEGASEMEARGEGREEIIRAVLPIYQDPEANLQLYMLSESLVEFDEQLALWREHHVRVVERVIGFKKGTGGSSGAEYLRTTTSKKAFPYLWDVRTYLEKAT